VVEEGVRRMTENRDPYESLQEFIANDPLYRWFDLGQHFDESSIRSVGSVGQVINMEKVYRRCDHPRCKAERPFNRMSGEGSPYGGGSAFHQEPGLDVEQSSDAPRRPTGPVYAFYFVCTGCNDSVFHCWVEADPQYWQPGKKRIRKVGQAPPWEITPPDELRDAFGEDIDLYKNARVCMSQSYGMAACAYLRRILESRTTVLLETLRDNRKAEGASEDDLRRIEEALSERTAEIRTRVASEALPDSVKLAEGNPLAIIYDQLSDALHRSDEQECAVAAERVSKLLEHLVIRLRAEWLERRQRKVYEDVFRELRG
jgi:hypothetical protein